MREDLQNRYNASHGEIKNRTKMRHMVCKQSLTALKNDILGESADPIFLSSTKLIGRRRPELYGISIK